MALLVQKFGGSSVKDPAHIRAVARLIARRHRRGDQLIATVSAMGSETDELLKLGASVADIQPSRELDLLITSGERKSTALLCLALQELDVPAVALSGGEAGIATDGDHTRAKILAVDPAPVEAVLARGSVPVVSGAQGQTASDADTFLGRGGTDTTAVALAAALHADACELYTDVAGVCSADPRVVPQARLLPALSFELMLAMCAAGCPKPAAQSVRLAQALNVPLRVKPTAAGGAGTVIGHSGGEHAAAVLAEGRHSAAAGARRTLVTVVSARVRAGDEVTHAVRQALAKQRIAAVEHAARAASPLTLAYAVAAQDAERAVRALHRALIEGHDRKAPARSERHAR